MKIIASDFDNTIYFIDDSKKNQNNIEAIRKFVDNGNIFIIITGRNYSSLKKYIEKLNIPYTYIITDDGAKIFDKNDECINTIKLGINSINKVIPILEKEKANYYLDDGLSKNDNKNECVKIVVNCTDEKDKKRMLEIIKDTDIHIYASRRHVNIINKKVNKAMALRKLFELENLNLDDIFVIGDNDNDYEMLSKFKGGVIKKHSKILDELNKDEYETLYDFISIIS